jgi:hypothetical protein
MKEKRVELSGPDHPISIESSPARAVIFVAGLVVAGIYANGETLPPVEKNLYPFCAVKHHILQ